MTAVTRMAAAIQARLRAVFHRGAVDREMRDEMALHLEQATERLRRRGLSAAEARNAARREFAAPLAPDALIADLGHPTPRRKPW